MKLDFDDHDDDHDNCADELLPVGPPESPLRDLLSLVGLVVLLFGTLAGVALLADWLGGPLK